MTLASRSPLHLTRTIAFKLFVLTAITQSALLAVLAFAVIRVHENHLTQTVEESAHRLSDLIGRSTRHSMMRNQKDDVQSVVTAIGSQPGIEGIRIFSKRGVIVYSTVDEERGQAVERHTDVCAPCHSAGGNTVPPDGGSSLTRVYSREGHDRILCLVTPIQNESQCATGGCHAHLPGETKLGVLEVRMSLAKVDEGITESRLQLLALSLAAIILAGVIAGGFIWWLVHRPVQDLVAGMRHASHGRLDQRLANHSNDEIGDLAEEFNMMMEELARARTEITNWSHTLEEKVAHKTADLERAHRQVVQAEKMASLGRLSASVAHELNNPLEGILTFSKLLLKRLQKPGLPLEFVAAASEELQLVADEAQRCGDIVRNLLLFSRQGSTAFRSARLGAILERCERLIHHRASLNGIRVQTTCTPDDAIECDQGQIQQVLLALMLNAVEAMSIPVAEKNGGDLRVDIARDESGGDFLLSIRDTGVGIAPELQGRVFDPFFTTKAEARGVGLGLSVAFGIVERHSGSMRVESTTGEGSVFTVRLPSRQTNGGISGAALNAKEVSTYEEK